MTSKLQEAAIMFIVDGLNSADLNEPFEFRSKLEEGGIFLDFEAISKSIGIDALPSYLF